MNKKLISILILLTLAVLTGLGFAGGKYFFKQQPLLDGNILDTPENRQIMETIDRAYEIEREAANTFNAERFAQVFINDPRFPLDPDTLQVVREMTYDPALETAGFLDYKLAYYTWWQNGVLKREALEAKAKAENRDLTEDEQKSLVDQYGRSAPMRHQPEPDKNIPPLNFLALEINEDIAIVKLDDGPTIVEYTLVFINQHWYVAGMKILTVKI